MSTGDDNEDDYYDNDDNDDCSDDDNSSDDGGHSNSDYDDVDGGGDGGSGDDQLEDGVIISPVDWRRSCQFSKLPACHPQLLQLKMTMTKRRRRPMLRWG